MDKVGRVAGLPAMSLKEFDAEDIGMLVLGLFSAAVLVGIASVEAFGVSLSDTFSFMGYSASIAWVVSVGVLVGTVVTNDHTELLSTNGYEELMNSSMDDTYAYAVLGTAALLVAWVFVPEVADFVKSEDLWGVGYIGLVATGQIAIGWVY